MQKKFILVSLLASMALIALVAVSLTVFALTVVPAAAQSEQAVTIEIVPVQAKPAAVQHIRYEGYSGEGCSHSAKMQMTQKAEEPKQTSAEQLLTQVR